MNNPFVQFLKLMLASGLIFVPMLGAIMFLDWYFNKGKK